MTISQFLSLFETQMKNNEYEGARRTLNQLQNLGLEEFHIQLLTGMLYDCTDRTQEAEYLFRQVMKSNAPNSLILQARQGLKNIQEREQKRRMASIALEMTNPENKDDGLLILCPVDVSSKEQKAEALARVFALDIYTARAVLPTRYRKIYRLGRYGEMKVYAQELKQYGIDSLPVRLKTIGDIAVHSVLYLEEDQDGLKISTKNKEITIPWQEVKRIVKGQVPMLEEVVTGVNKKYQIVKEEQTKEFLLIVDLHCHNMIIRLEDQQYQFNNGKKFHGDNATMMSKWKELINWLEKKTNVPVEDEFLPFAEMALLYPETLEAISPKISFPRTKPCLWDNSFHLYSGIFWRAE